MKCEHGFRYDEKIRNEWVDIKNTRDEHGLGSGEKWKKKQEVNLVWDMMKK